MKMTKTQYSDYVNSLAPKSPMLKNICIAFLVGGGICTLGQLLMNGYGALGLGKTDAGMLTSATLVLLSILATGLSVYDNLAKHAGAGTLVPITGFANSIAAPAIEFRAEGLVTGTAVKMFSIAGPVIVYGVSASVVYGVIYWFCTAM